MLGGETKKQTVTKTNQNHHKTQHFEKPRTYEQNHTWKKNKNALVFSARTLAKSKWHEKLNQNRNVFCPFWLILQNQTDNENFWTNAHPRPPQNTSETTLQNLNKERKLLNEFTPETTSKHLRDNFTKPQQGAKTSERIHTRDNLKTPPRQLDKTSTGSKNTRNTVSKINTKHQSPNQ